MQPIFSGDHQWCTEQTVDSPEPTFAFFFLFVPYSLSRNSAIWLGSIGGIRIYINNKQEETITKIMIATINLRYYDVNYTFHIALLTPKGGLSENTYTYMHKAVSSSSVSSPV